ncbi:hypothetical protein ACHHYP_10428 [Achlya hypogyna]|uniref:Ribosomal protein eL8/eL30/eS12/Gadd45 domain-containing protein n=1 Tax=Achlya hypogyna TaxID=1202772 RepID=A0A1V9YLF0_ACHHY|nr:hypothetical protein ACHHYP_10428 [Achlya hypogyna]
MRGECDDPSAACLRSCPGVNWTAVCRLTFSNNWSCCGLAHYNVVVPVTVWALFLAISFWFGWYTGIVRELRTSVDALHDINTQALGVVVARQTQSVLGREIGDPRRILMLLAMVSELVGFSYLPMQLLLYEYTDGTFTAQSSADFQLLKFYTFSSLLFILLLPSKITRRIRGLLTKALAPLLFDTCSILYMYTLIDIGACTNGMDSWILADGTTCAQPERYWIFATLGVTAFVLFYWNMLQYKRRLNNQVFAVRFRYQTSFGSLISYTRTACCLSFFTIQKLLLYFDKIYVFLAFAVLNTILFSLLLRYNYMNQPCLGVGLFPNNLRSLSFATSCYSSVVLLIISYQLQLHGRTSMSSAEKIVFKGAAGAYVVFAAAVWYINTQRARQYHVPNLSLKESLVHKAPRVRAIAAVSIALEDQSRWSSADVLELVELLHKNLSTLASVEHGLVLVYTCQALWNLWYKHFPEQHPFLEDSAGECLPPAFWSSMRRFSAEAKDSTRVVVPQERTKSETSALLRLVDRTMTIGSHTKRCTQQLECSPRVRTVMAACIRALGTLVRLTNSQTRLIAARILHEMYMAHVVRLSPATMVFVCCSLCASPAQASAAAATLYRLFAMYVECADEGVSAHYADYWNLVHLSQYILDGSQQKEETSRVEGVASVVLAIVESIKDAALKSNPANHLSETFVNNLIRAQANVTTSYQLYSMLDDIFLATYWACDAYLEELHRVNHEVARTKRRSERRTRLFSLRNTLLTNAVVPASPAPPIRRRGGDPAKPRHSVLSVQMITSFLIRSKTSNLISPDHLNTIKTRKTQEARLLVQIYLVLREGLDEHLVPSALRPATQAVLQTVIRSFTECPMLLLHFKRRLRPIEAEYIAHLYMVLAPKQPGVLREAILSFGNARKATSPSMPGPTAAAASTPAVPNRRWEQQVVPAPTHAPPPAPVVAVVATSQPGKKKTRPKRPSNGQVNLLDFVAKPKHVAKPTSKSAAKPKTVVGVKAPALTMRATAQPFIPMRPLTAPSLPNASEAIVPASLTDAALPAGKKKKKRSTLKKKILRDREAKWVAFHAEKRSAVEDASAVNPDQSRSVQIYNLVEPEEIEDDDEFDDTLVDVREQLARHGCITALAIERTTGVVLVTYNSAASADAAVAVFHNATFGGRKIIALYAVGEKIDAASWITVTKYVEPSDVHDDDEFEEVLDEARTLFAKYFPVRALEIDRVSGVIRVQYETPVDAKVTADRYHLKSFGGIPIHVQWSGGPTTSYAVAPLQTTNVPPVRKLRNSSQIREYVDQKADVGGILETQVGTLLGRLMQLQERARLTNPLKAKKSRRLVFGLREVKRGLKSLKVMCLFVAYDVDECAAEGGLDDKVVELIDLARAAKIPVVFSLSKRKLGRAVLKSIRVSCVAVYSVDGANDIWNDLRTTVASLQPDPAPAQDTPKDPNTIS